MQTIWALFQEYGSGGIATAGWLRTGTISGTTLTWIGDPIPTPSHIWAFTPSGAYTGYIHRDPLDPNRIWVAYLENTGGVFHNRAFVYNHTAGTWTSVLNSPLIGPTAPFCVDMAFDVDGTCFMAIAGDGARGGSGLAGEAGIYRSLARGAFTFRGSGFDHSPMSGNINAPVAVTALTIIPTTEAGTRVLIAAHTLARTGTSQTTGWVTSRSADDGSSWHDPIATYSGNQFQLECFTMCRIGGNTGGLFYASDHSGTGAYSTANLSSTIGGNPVDGPNGSVGGPLFESGSIAHTFPTDGNKAVAYPTAIATSLDVYHSANGGATWGATTLGLGFAAFAYRGARTAEDSLWTAGVTIATPAHSSELVWSEDAGATWHATLAESTAIGLSLDFGPAEVTTVSVLQETLTFRDSRMFVGQSRFYVSGSTDTELHDNAEAMSNLLDVLSNALLTGTVGPYSSPPVAPGPGVPEVYQNIETVIRLTWITADGVAIGIDVPAPLQELFIDDQESYVLLSPFIADAAAGAITYKVCTRGGELAVSFVGASRIMRGFRATQNIRTLDPSETFTGE